MIASLRALLLLACLQFGLVTSVTAQDNSELRTLLDSLAGASLRELGSIVDDIAASGDDTALAILDALQAGDLVSLRDGGAVYIGRRSGRDYRLTDPITGENGATVASGAVERIRVNNALRRGISAALGAVTLMSDNPIRRIAAARQAFSARDPDRLEALDAALAEETDAGIAAILREGRAATILSAPAPDDQKLGAIETIAARGDREALAILSNLADPSPAVAESAAAARAEIERALALWTMGQNVFYGLSLGSVLLLAAVGLAVTFGVMGVINMAHGEMVMIGAYTTYVVQSVIRAEAPWLFDSSLFIAIPTAFLIAGLVGIAIERGIIRFLYGRPLETLLATWGVSLILQQAVRTIFGASNREVGIPSWMSGAVEVGGMSITLNRLTIIVFSLIVFAGLMIVLKYTRFGLQMRAVTQNRAMARSMGIRSSFVDAMTFGLGSGIAGVAGVALSQIDNVSPNLGQGYIIDSFMVVVFGGVGNLWGTLVAALSLGVANKFLEPYAGAVLAKIVILVLIILFIQKRPRGLFAQRGRAVEA